MASEIAIIKVPAPIVTLQQFAELEGFHTAPRVAGLPEITHVYLSNLALSVRAVNVLAVKFVSTTPAGKRIKCVRRWVIPVFNLSSVRNSLYVNFKDAAC